MCCLGYCVMYAHGYLIEEIKMTIFASAYDTTAGSGFVIRPVVDALAQAIIVTDFYKRVNQLPDVKFQNSHGFVPTLVTNGSQEELHIPYYAHPVVVKFNGMKSRENEAYVVGDVRPFLSGTSSVQEHMQIRNSTEFGLMRARTALTAHWMNGKVASFKYLSPKLMAIYASWVSENLARPFVLDGKNQQLVAILAAYHYYCLFTDEKVFPESQLQQIAAAISRAVYATAEEVFRILDRVEEMKDIHDLCKAIKDICEDTRLEDLNAGTLISIISTTWYGTNARETAAVALEHPPTFAVIVYGAFTSRTFKNSPLSRICERYRGNKGESEFVRGLIVLLDDATRK